MPKKIKDVSKRILEAATEIYLHEGYDKISIRRISAISGLAVGTVYTRFEDKEEVVALVLANEIERIKELVISAVFNKSPKDALYAALQTFFEKVNDSSNEAFEHVLNIEGHQEYIQKTLTGASNQIKDVLKEIIIRVYSDYQTNISEESATVLSEVSFGMIHMLSKMKKYEISKKAQFVFEFICAYGENGAKGVIGNE